MFVTEALDSTEDVKASRVLVGRGGFLLKRALARRGWNLEKDFRVVPSLFCFPSQSPRRKKPDALTTWAADALATCAPNLDAEIEKWKPTVIIPLGETAFTALTGQQHPMMAARGYVFRDRRDRTWVLPTFDPNWILMGQNVYAQVLVRDVEKAMRIVKEGGYAYERPTCLLNPSLPEWEAFVSGFLATDALTNPLALDIETPYKTEGDDEDELDVVIADPTDRDESYIVNTYSFAYQDVNGNDIGVSIPNTPIYAEGVRTLVLAASQKV